MTFYKRHFPLTFQTVGSKGLSFYHGGYLVFTHLHRAKHGGDHAVLLDDVSTFTKQTNKAYCSERLLHVSVASKWFYWQHGLHYPFFFFGGGGGGS